MSAQPKKADANRGQCGSIELGSRSSARSAIAHARPSRPLSSAAFLRTYVFSLDHKVIGIQFLFSTLLWFVVGGLLALAVRWQLAWPWSDMPIVGRMLFSAEGGQISPEFYTMLFTMHATVMIFFVIIPILAGAFGNFLIPLMIGADDMAFPTLNMLSYWFMWPAFICMIGSFFVAGGAAAAGWTGYPTLSAVQAAAPGSQTGQTLWLIGLTFVGVSSMMGSVNYMTTIIQMRAPGMTMFRMPMTIWAMFITAILQAFALPVLTAAGFMQLLDRMLGTGFFIPEGLIVNNVVGRRRRRPAAALAALVLVLFAPGRVHHDPAGDGHGLRHHRLLRPQAAVRLQADGLFDLRHRRAGLHRLGASHVHVGHEPVLGMTFMVSTMMIAPAQRRESLQLAGHDLGRQNPVHHADAVRPGVRVDVHHRRAVGHLHGRHAGRYLHPRHVLHRGPHSLRAVRRHGDRRVRRRSISGSPRCSAG